MSNDKTEDFTIGPVTLAFPSLFTPSRPKDSESDEKYNTAIIMSGELYESQIKPKIDALIAANFQKGETSNNRFNWGFLPCSSKPATYPPELTANMWYGNAKSTYKTDVVDAGQLPIMDPNLIRDGAQAYISIKLYTFNKAGNVGIGVGLGPVMYVGEGPALNVGGGISAGAAFSGVTIDPSLAPAPVQPGVAVPQAAVAPAPVAPAPVAPAPVAPAPVAPAPVAPAPVAPAAVAPAPVAPAAVAPAPAAPAIAPAPPTAPTA